jgi:menaquinone-dependent protoporphyrinogen IX oxidase
MKGLVVYQSFWGSCATVAEAIASGLSAAGVEARAVAVEEAGMPDPALDFVVVGGATRWPGARHKIKDYARAAVEAGPRGKPFATFSTGGTVGTDKQNTQASEILSEILETGGLSPLAPPFKARIEGYKPPGITKGTLPETEITRAEGFGRELAAKLNSG